VKAERLGVELAEVARPTPYHCTIGPHNH